METDFSVHKNIHTFMHIQKKPFLLSALEAYGLGWPFHLYWLAGQPPYCSATVDS